MGQQTLTHNDIEKQIAELQGRVTELELKLSGAMKSLEAASEFSNTATEAVENLYKAHNDLIKAQDDINNIFKFMLLNGFGQEKFDEMVSEFSEKRRLDSEKAKEIVNKNDEKTAQK